MVGSFGDYLRLADIEFFEVVEKILRIILGNLPRRFILFSRRLSHLVFTFVAVAEKMSYVGYVHNTLELVAVVFEYASENIHKDISPQVADMSVTVYRRSATVH